MVKRIIISVLTVLLVVLMITPKVNADSWELYQDDTTYSFELGGDIGVDGYDYSFSSKRDNFNNTINDFLEEIYYDMYLDYKMIDIDYANSLTDNLTLNYTNDSTSLNLLFDYVIFNLPYDLPVKIGSTTYLTKKIVRSFEISINLEIDMSMIPYYKIIFKETYLMTSDNYITNNLSLGLYGSSFSSLNILDVPIYLQEELDSEDYELYWEGYDAGKKVSGQPFYEQGYKEGKEEYAIFYQGQYISAYDYGQIKYLEGLNDAGEGNVELIQFLPGVLGAIFMFFFQVFSIEILGITIIQVLATIASITALFFLLKMFLR